MRVAKELRPKARWAFWDYPMCNYDVGYSGELECRPQYEIINDQMLWLFNAQDLILPQLYFYEQVSTSPKANYTCLYSPTRHSSDRTTFMPRYSLQ